MAPGLLRTKDFFTEAALIFRESSSESRRDTIAAAKLPASPLSARIPVLPLSMIVGMPPTSAATEGTPVIWASQRLLGLFSM